MPKHILSDGRQEIQYMLSERLDHWRYAIAEVPSIGAKTSHVHREMADGYLLIEKGKKQKVNERKLLVL